MGQLLSILMVLGGDTSKGESDPLDDTIPLDVAGGESRSNTDRIRYHLPDNDLDDIELEDDERSAQYYNTPVLRTTTLEMTCGGDTADMQRASRPKLNVINSAGQSENTTRGLNSDRQRLTDRLTPVECTLQSTLATSGKGGGTHLQTR